VVSVQQAKGAVEKMKQIIAEMIRRNTGVEEVGDGKENMTAPFASTRQGSNRPAPTVRNFL
jgi:hypothetical protein